MSESPGVLTRREFLKDSLAGALVVGSGVQSAASAEVAAPNSGLPWYRRAYLGPDEYHGERSRPLRSGSGRAQLDSGDGRCLWSPGSEREPRGRRSPGCRADPHPRRI
jgi:hypothetical protein